VFDIHNDMVGLKGGKDETVKVTGPNGETEMFKFNMDRFDECIAGYADRHGIVLPEIYTYDAAEMLPEIPTKEDPWNTAAAFRKYERWYGTVRNGGPESRPTIGGDKLDITTWTSSERKADSLTKRAPLGERAIAALKMGMITSLE
jgi:hypothetical protein